MKVKKMDPKWIAGVGVLLIIVATQLPLSGGSSQGAGVLSSIQSFFFGSTVKVTGNGAPAGAHFNLNIIGVPKGKKADGDSNGRRIFVPLTGKCTIALTPGDFSVLDYNCTDGRSGLQLPDPDPDGDGVTAYSVYARALGKPGGKATATSCVTDGIDTWCSTEMLALIRTSGKQTFVNASKELLTICMDTDGDRICDTRTYLFDDSTLSYFWDYDNNGLRIAQLRFYEVATDIGLTP